MDNQKDDRLGTDAGVKPRRCWARRLGLLSGLILGGVAAGFVFGQLAVVDTQQTYCNYLYQGLSSAQVSALTADGVNPQFAGIPGSYYICVACADSTSGCGDAAALPTPLNPNNPPNANIVVQSNSCGSCHNPGTSS